MRIKTHILPIIVIAQFCCTSLWFAGNAVIYDLILNFGLKEQDLGHITSSVQFGFIIGTFLFALFTITDRFSPSKVFFLCALLAAAFNAMMVLSFNSFVSLLFFRFLTGFFLAGIYPVGMKIASDYFQKGLGKSLGYLVGALVLGTALPHLLKVFQTAISWRFVIFTTSVLSVLGGTLILLFVPNGPFRKKLSGLELSTLFTIFRNGKFKRAAFGYFGHMWELYAFWTFVPLFISEYMKRHEYQNSNLALISFAIIAIGSIGCAVSGYFTSFFSSRKIVIWALGSSGICCLLAPLCFEIDSFIVFLGLLLFWGFTVIADSPLFSSMVAQSTSLETKGTALTIVNSIGFAITIVSIQVLSYFIPRLGIEYAFVILALGPVFGLFHLLKK